MTHIQPLFPFLNLKIVDFIGNHLIAVDFDIHIYIYTYAYMCIYIHIHIDIVHTHIYLYRHIPNVLNKNPYSQLETHLPRPEECFGFFFPGAPADGVCPKPGEVRSRS